MEGNEMCVAFEQRLFGRRMGLGGVGRMGCTLVTGFLGSGKTTLLRHILRHRGNLRLAVIVNEFADFDVDSLLLDSERLSKAFNLPPVSFTLGCGSRDVTESFRDVLRGIVDSKQNFDCLLIETSGLARPDKFVTTLEEFGLQLDMTVAVVDAESLDDVIKLDIAKKQLQHVDLILLNKCDLASLSQISRAEDTLEALTGGAKIVRCQFCRVPIELIIDCSKTESPIIGKEATTDIPFLSHESLSKKTFQGAAHDNASIGISSLIKTDKQPGLQGETEELKTSLSHGNTFSSVTFRSEIPMTLSLFQSSALQMMNKSSGLLRAKGIMWFAEDREKQYVFQWSGVKRVEAVCSGRWEAAPKSCLVMIGVDQSDLDGILETLHTSSDPLKNIHMNINCEEFLETLASKISADGRFKEPCMEKMPLIVFGLKGSPLRGVKESQLNGALMHMINGRGLIFLTADAASQDYRLLYLPSLVLNPDQVWDEIRLAAGRVISKLCKNFCTCRCELAAHVH